MDALDLCLRGIRNVLDDVALDCSCDAEGDRDAVVDDSVDQRHRKALVLVGHVVGENDGGCWERHVHSERHDDD